VRSDPERLADILDAARKIAIKVSDGQDAFMRDEYVQLALAHLVQIIGEAAARLSDNVTSQNPEIPWRQIIAMRNLVVHGYFDVDANILWTVVSVDVPRLADQISATWAGSGLPDGQGVKPDGR
jgi:uncharacterized protein with HEPN domain